MTRLETQEQKILEHLKSGKAITPIEALNNYGCFRLASAIHRLRKQYLINTDLVTEDSGKTYASYTLIASSENAQT